MIPGMGAQVVRAQEIVLFIKKGCKTSLKLKSGELRIFSLKTISSVA